ncbi:MAG: MBL fold metallo-hydrolase [Pseudomonadota bacterium]
MPVNTTNKPDYLSLDAPEFGQRVEIVDGVYWLRMPLPFLLGHINVWMLRNDDNSVSIVDTGLNTDDTQSHWRALIGNTVLREVIATHLHPDHIGSAGWLCDTYDAPLIMSRVDYLMCRVLVSDTGKTAPEEGVDFYRSAGFDEAAIERYKAMFGGFGTMVSTLPVSFRRLRDGDTLHAAGRDWRIIITGGHCPEHASLYCEAERLFISGDQILPTISSNVSVWPTEPEADPLGDWLDACERLKRELHPDTLVMPSHGKPFHGVTDRLQALLDEHHQGLAKLRTHCIEPRRVVDTFEVLFKGRISEGNLIMATGEAQAHLNYLIHRHQIESTLTDGVAWYRTVG